MLFDKSNLHKKSDFTKPIFQTYKHLTESKRNFIIRLTNLVSY